MSPPPSLSALTTSVSAPAATFFSSVNVKAASTMNTNASANIAAAAAAAATADVASAIHPTTPAATTNQTSTYRLEMAHFGYETVPLEQKQDRVQNVFDAVASRYDLMNDILSMGYHRLWKDTFVDQTGVAAIARSIRQQQQQQEQPTTTPTTKSTTTRTTRTVRPPLFAMLDVAGGTGDIAFRLLTAAGCTEQKAMPLSSRCRTTGNGTNTITTTTTTTATSDVDAMIQIVVCDLNISMLDVGYQRAQQQYPECLESGALQFVVGNAQDLCQQQQLQLQRRGRQFASFKDNHQQFDLYTISFGLRNVTDVDAALREAVRVLKPGGRFMCLEFTGGGGGSNMNDTGANASSAGAMMYEQQKQQQQQRPSSSSSTLDSLYDWYSFQIIPWLGEMVANDRASYQYLVQSIRQFDTAEQLQQRMERAGLVNTSYRSLHPANVVMIHQGWKPICEY